MWLWIITYEAGNLLGFAMSVTKKIAHSLDHESVTWDSFLLHYATHLPLKRRWKPDGKWASSQATYWIFVGWSLGSRHNQKVLVVGGMIRMVLMDICNTDIPQVEKVRESNVVCGWRGGGVYRPSIALEGTNHDAAQRSWSRRLSRGQGRQYSLGFALIVLCAEITSCECTTLRCKESGKAERQKIVRWKLNSAWIPVLSRELVILPCFFEPIHHLM